MSSEANAVPEVGMPLVDLAEMPRTAAQWEELREAHDAHVTATERRASRERALGFLVAGVSLTTGFGLAGSSLAEGAKLASAGLASGVVVVPDGGGWGALVAFVALMVSFIGGMSVAFNGLTRPKHPLDDIASWEFEDISESVLLRLPEFAKADQVIARYIQEVLAQGRSLRKAEAGAIDLRVAQAHNARHLQAHAAQVATAKDMLLSLTEEGVQRAQDQQVAVDFYTQNPSAALFDFNKRFTRETTPA